MILGDGCANSDGVTPVDGTCNGCMPILMRVSVIVSGVAPMPVSVLGTVNPLMLGSPLGDTSVPVVTLTLGSADGLV
jgi:hypothetical protein